MTGREKKRRGEKSGETKTGEREPEIERGKREKMWQEEEESGKKKAKQ